MRVAEQMLLHSVHWGKQIKKKTDYLLLVVVWHIIEVLVVDLELCRMKFIRFARLRTWCWGWPSSQLGRGMTITDSSLFGARDNRLQRFGDLNGWVVRRFQDSAVKGLARIVVETKCNPVVDSQRAQHILVFEQDLPGVNVDFRGCSCGCSCSV